jgi:DMSO/TMAO reductase YedYZ molybdopterin-dependent catalytic subunit
MMPFYPISSQKSKISHLQWIYAIPFTEKEQDYSRGMVGTIIYGRTKQFKRIKRN